MQLVGEHLGFSGVSEYAAATLDQLIDGSSADGYTTTGIPSDVFQIERLYDRDWPGNNWPTSALTELINNGLHVINHLGHGSPGYAMKYTSAQLMTYMENDDLFFLYSQTCLAGHFDGTDCWAEYATIKSDHAAFAVVMNARYGFGAYNSTDGASQRFNREFWDAVYNSAEAKPQLGMANADAKEDNLYRINEPCMRWVYYESNLFGDPTVRLHDGGVWFTLDSPYGWVPHTVSFQGEASREVDAWIWDFGDGDSAFVQNPTHVFDERGMCDVTLTISCDGEQVSRTNCGCVAALADSMYADTVLAVAGETVEVVISATNTVPVSQFMIPVQYSGVLGLNQSAVTWSTEGCRTAGLDLQQQIHFNPVGYEMTFRLANQGASQDVAPGQGPILKIFFQLDGAPAFGEETVIDISGYNNYVPGFENSVFDYDPIVINGLIHNPDCCQGFRGNVDGDSDDIIEITDLIYLVQFMFQDGPEPPCMKEANVNGGIFGEIDIEDLIMLVNYMFQDGPEPVECL